MKTWTRAVVATICGRCCRVITTGEPLLIVDIPGRRPGASGVRLRRCEACDGPAPPDLPTDIQRAPALVAPMEPLKGITRSLPFDRPTTDREPGEEG